MSKKEEDFNYLDFEKEAISKLRSGKGFTGDGGAVTSLISRLVKAAYDEEIKEHLTVDSLSSNRKNGYTKKRVNTGLGPIDVYPPRDRNGTFDPKIIEKWDRHLAPELEQQILALYGRGSSYSDIRSHFKSMYGIDYSESFISSVTDRIHEEINLWKHRPLESCYVVIYLDAIHFKVREDRQVKSKAVYSVLGVDKEGNRDVLSIEIGQNEGARHWARVLENLYDRGVEDVLFFCVDGLKGFSEAIESVYPQSIVQRCIVHMLRTSLKFVNWKDYKAVCKDLRKMYSQDSIAAAEQELEYFDQKWKSKYPGIKKKWEKNWAELSPFFDYSSAVRKMIYTTNAVEALHRCLRKTTKTKGAFINEQALEKQLYLTLKYNQKSWKRKVRNWKAISQSLSREFPKQMGEE